MIGKIILACFEDHEAMSVSLAQLNNWFESCIGTFFYEVSDNEP